MNDPVPERLLEVARRRELTPPEQASLEAWLSAHPDARAEWEEEQVLTRWLRGLPPAAVPTNFTAQVLQAVEHHERRHGRRAFRRHRLWSIRPVWRGFAVGATVMLAVAAYFDHRARTQAEMAETVAAVSTLTDLPTIEALMEFDAVYHLSSAPLPDSRELAQALE